ncbi:UTRA domain-containing protein [Spartinivicinus poritis]|uniref:UTRA domain-containing protein n=1 Tax=Spartinivicinus poritis TaxID=2994640 RepID=A0ABT5UCB0_9GAMM|nr:UTRA domain-containing protein [Spartinivicinus sp. A2-2]MDE1464013.1 UTRA domain-containing protein [Spartinivicinus sp. A2-2]
MLIEHIYLNMDLLPDIQTEDISQSLTHLLRRKYAFKSTALKSDAAQALGISAGLPGLFIERIN